MSSTESSIHWALSKFKSHIPLSCDPREDALLATLLRPPVYSGCGKPTQSSKTGPIPAISRELAESCIAAAQRLSDVCVASGRVNYDEVNRLNDNWNAVHAERTRAWAEDAFASVRSAVSSVKKISSTTLREHQKKPIFNHEYTPLLEKYFEFNAYPSAPDRAILARKSMMTPRQIEVWFQNHRNRAKKEGKLLRRSTHPLPQELNLTSMEEKMSYFAIPEREPPHSKESISDITVDAMTGYIHCAPRTIQHTPIEATLNPPRPLYAFPAVYSKGSKPQFLVQGNSFEFPPPGWRRKPSQCPPATRTPIDMNALILDFNQKLHLRTPPSHNQSSLSWCAGRTIIPCLAPLPALIRQTTMQTPLPFLRTSTSASSLLSSPPTQISSHPTPFSTFISPISPSPRLPKRTPSTFGSRQTSTISEKSPTTSPSNYRSLSLSSHSSRRSSLSSSGSAVSSALTTPEQPTILLPGNQCSHLIPVLALS